MSENTRLSNEELIDELTEDLEAKLCSENDKNPVEPDEENNDDSSSEADEQCHESLEFIDELIDEEKLKELENDLTPEELEERRRNALEFKKQGNLEYKNQQYLESVKTYTEALKICPTKYNEERSILYGNRAASKLNVDRKKSAIKDCTKSIELNGKYIRAYLRRAKLYEEEDKLEESLEDFKKVLEMDPGCVEALSANQRLPPKINEKNEKLKEEMLGKLKDLGNLILRPFGLSTDNFKLEQNAETGGYSVNFQQNAGQNS